jgi:glycosyltransferase involved in cell wall biosynthesis
LEENPPVVDVICSVLNGERFLPEFFRSLEAQTHSAWRLWLRDDGSTDRTVELFHQWAGRDARVQVLDASGRRLGVAQSFGWMLEHLPQPSDYVLPADADDVWLPGKIARTLAAMRAAERESGVSTPILVHTDLTVVEADLRERHPSYWKYSRMQIEPATVRRLLLRNVATGPTLMLNAALRARVVPTPMEMRHHDWWYALVAAATGRVVAVHESTVLYRQHGTNDVGAVAGDVSLRDLPRVARRAFARTDAYRAGIGLVGRQGLALLERHGDRLSESDRRFIQALARLPNYSSLRRKIEMLRLRAFAQPGALRKLGALLRA